MLNPFAFTLTFTGFVLITAQDFGKICKLPSSKGNCKSSLNVWFFNAASGQCEPFEFSGCNGNANRFGNKDDCQRLCNAGRVKRDYVEKTYDSECEMELDQGTGCRGGFARFYPGSLRWYWNTEKSACLSFHYNGCGGNKNNFPTYDLCFDRCKT